MTKTRYLYGITYTWTRTLTHGVVATRIDQLPPLRTQGRFVAQIWSETPEGAIAYYRSMEVSP